MKDQGRILLNIWNSCLWERSEGSREDIIEYMESVGYQYLPWGHKVKTGFFKYLT